MKVGYIRPIAICVCLKDDRILVFEGHDPLKNQTFYRPLGGGMEFQELSLQTVIREFREELKVTIHNPRLLGTLENIFSYKGQKGHELVFVYDGELTDPELYQQEEIIGYEDDGSAFLAMWKPLEFFQSGQAPLYPDGLLELLLKQS